MEGVSYPGLDIQNRWISRVEGEALKREFSDTATVKRISRCSTERDNLSLTAVSPLYTLLQAKVTPVVF